ncbi:MAG: hypothetical protein V1839_01500 [archaeon]
MEHDILAKVLEVVRGAEARGKTEISVTPASRLIRHVLEILKN